MTAPDPGLTDLIAAHHPSGHYMATNEIRCGCGWLGPASDWPAHVALVVEQHTNGRIAEANDRAKARVKAANKRAKIRITQIRKEESARFEAEAKVAKLEAERDVPSRLVIEDLRRALTVQDAALATAQATIARVLTSLEVAERSVPDDWGVTYIYTSRLRAALEGEQQ